MTKERRWFCKVKSLLGHGFCVVYGYPDFAWPRSDPLPIYNYEIPKEFWGLETNDYIKYFENGVKPRIRRKCDGEEKEESRSLIHKDPIDG